MRRHSDRGVGVRAVEPGGRPCAATRISRWSGSSATAASISTPARSASSSASSPCRFHSASAARSRITTARWRGSRGRTATSCRSRGASCSDGVCDGCALGTSGLSDWTMPGVHLCMVRLELMRLNTAPALDAVAPRRRAPSLTSLHVAASCASSAGCRSRCCGAAASAGFCVGHVGRGARSHRRGAARGRPAARGLLSDVARHHQRGLLRGAEGGAVPRQQARRQLGAPVPRGVDRRR